MSSCLSSSREKMRTSATSPASSRRTMVLPNEPVPPVTSTVELAVAGASVMSLPSSVLFTGRPREAWSAG
jgi:hypothetical protein